MTLLQPSEFQWYAKLVQNSFEYSSSRNDSTPKVYKVTFKDVQNHYSKVLVYKIRNKPVGLVRIVITYRMFNKLNATLQIEEVCIEKTCRHRGYGTQMIDQTIQFCKANYPAYKIVLFCSENLTNFYKTWFQKTHCGMSIYCQSS